MKLKLLAIALIVLLVVAICYVGGLVYFGIYGHSGTAMNKQALIQIYQAAGPDLTEFSNNSFLLKLQFTAPIQWHRSVWRPSVAATSRVDVAKFRRDMRDEPFVYLHPDNLSQASGTVYYFKLLHRMKDDCVVMTEGTLDMASALSGCGPCLWKRRPTILPGIT